MYPCFTFQKRNRQNETSENSFFTNLWFCKKKTVPNTEPHKRPNILQAKLSQSVGFLTSWIVFFAAFLPFAMSEKALLFSLNRNFLSDNLQPSHQIEFDYSQIPVSAKAPKVTSCRKDTTLRCELLKVIPEIKKNSNVSRPVFEEQLLKLFILKIDFFP